MLKYYILIHDILLYMQFKQPSILQIIYAGFPIHVY